MPVSWAREPTGSVKRPGRSVTHSFFQHGLCLSQEGRVVVFHHSPSFQRSQYHAAFSTMHAVLHGNRHARPDAPHRVLRGGIRGRGHHQRCPHQREYRYRETTGEIAGDRQGTGEADRQLPDQQWPVQQCAGAGEGPRYWERDSGEDRRPRFDGAFRQGIHVGCQGIHVGC